MRNLKATMIDFKDSEEFLKISPKVRQGRLLIKTRLIESGLAAEQGDRRIIELD